MHKLPYSHSSFLLTTQLHYTPAPLNPSRVAAIGPSIPPADGGRYHGGAQSLHMRVYWQLSIYNHLLSKPCFSPFKIKFSLSQMEFDANVNIVGGVFVKFFRFLLSLYTVFYWICSEQILLWLLHV